MDRKKTNTEIDGLLFRCLEGIASDAEYKQAQQWIHQSQQNKAYYSQMRDVWITADLLKPVNEVRQQQLWMQLEKKMFSETRKKTIRTVFFRWAAATAATAAMLTFAFLLGKQTSVQQNSTTIAGSEYTIEAPKGGKSLMTLIDGSKVWLNAGSVLHFDQSFGESNRTLALQGEAYFEVAHDTEHPFLVETSGITVVAVGTAFNLKAYPDDDLIETTLVEGVVRIETNRQSGTQSDPVILRPKQKAVFYKSRQWVSVGSNDTIPLLQVKPVTLQSFSKIEIAQNVDVEITTSWKDKRWIVQSESIGILAVKIERRYDVELIFENAELKKYKISATLEEETIEQLLNAIRLTVPMDYRIEHNQVFLKMNPQLKKKYDRLIQNN